MSPKILNAIIVKSCHITHEVLASSVAMLPVRVFQTQSEHLEEFPYVAIALVLSNNKLLHHISELSDQALYITPLCCCLLRKCLYIIQSKDDETLNYKNWLEALHSEINFQGEEARKWIRTALDSFQPPEVNGINDEVIEIDIYD